MDKKKVILTLCKVFPVTHSRAGEKTGFEQKLKNGIKKHTIRYNAKDVWDKRYNDISKSKKYLSVREWTGRPYNSEKRAEMENFKQGTVAKALGINVDDSKLHDALYDIEICKQICDIVLPRRTDSV